MTRPRDLGPALPDIGLTAWTSPLYRIQDGDRLVYGTYATPRHRFDALAGEYALLYANGTRVATFNETYAERRRRLGNSDARRHLVKISPERELSVVDLRDDLTLSAFASVGLVATTRREVSSEVQSFGEKLHTGLASRSPPRGALSRSTRLHLTLSFPRNCGNHRACASSISSTIE
jgi:hypothetical protein